MFVTTDKFTIVTKRNVGKFKSFLGLIAGFCFIFSAAYFIYFGLIFGSNDEVLLGYTRAYFDPLANYLHPEISGLEIYKETSISLAKFLIPLFVLYVISEIFQAIILNIHYKMEEIRNTNIKEREKRKYIEQFEKIKYFSIAVSFNYSKNDSAVAMQTINQLNKVIYDKMKNSLESKKVSVEVSGVFAVISANFAGYDVLYENLFKTIARIRKAVGEKYQIDIIPTISTDAHENYPDLNKIITTHFAIQGCNLKNKSVNTNTFCKKYNFLGFEKFIGTPIGFYSNQSSGVAAGYEEIYDLNIVFKNLTDKMDAF